MLGHWWEQVLHNQSALRLKARLLLERGVVVASVPYQLASAKRKPTDPAGDPLAGPRLLASREALDAAEIKQQLSELPRPRAGHQSRSPTAAHARDTSTWRARCARSRCGRGAPA